MKDKSKVLKTYGYMFDKLQFICLIGGRILTWGRRVPEAAEKSHDVGRRYRCNICVSH